MSVLLIFGEVGTMVYRVQNCGVYARKAEASQAPTLEPQNSTGLIPAAVRFLHPCSNIWQRFLLGKIHSHRVSSLAALDCCVVGSP